MTPTPPDHYLADATYQALVASLIAAAADPLDPHSAIMEALGEVGGIWPAEIRQGQADAA